MTREEFLKKIKKAKEIYAAQEAEKQEKAKAFMAELKARIEKAKGQE